PDRFRHRMELHPLDQPGEKRAQLLEVLERESVTAVSFHDPFATGHVGRRRYCCVPHSGQNLDRRGMLLPHSTQNFVSAPVAGVAPPDPVGAGFSGGGGAGALPPGAAGPWGRRAPNPCWPMASPAPSPTPTPAIPPPPSLAAAMGIDRATSNCV